MADNSGVVVELAAAMEVLPSAARPRHSRTASLSTTRRPSSPLAREAKLAAPPTGDGVEASAGAASGVPAAEDDAKEVPGGQGPPRASLSGSSRPASGLWGSHPFSPRVNAPVLPTRPDTRPNEVVAFFNTLQRVEEASVLIEDYVDTCVEGVVGPNPSAHSESEAKLKLAASFVRDALSERPFRLRNRDRASTWFYDWYNWQPLRTFVIFLTAAHCLLALVEAPNRLDVDEYPTSFHAPTSGAWRRDTEGLYVLAVESGIVVMYMLDILLKMRALGARNYFVVAEPTMSFKLPGDPEPRTVSRVEVWDITRCVCCLMFIIDICMAWGGVRLRWTRVLRPVYVVTYLRELRRWTYLALRSLPDVAPVFAMIFCMLFMFASIGNLLWSGVSFYDSSSLENFDTIGTSLTSVFVLFTLENYPDIMVPAFDRSMWSFVYFGSYILLVLFVMNNLLLPAVFRSFRRHRQSLALDLLQNELRFLAAAFACLTSNRLGRALIVTDERFVQLVTELRGVDATVHPELMLLELKCEAANLEMASPDPQAKRKHKNRAMRFFENGMLPTPVPDQVGNFTPSAIAKENPIDLFTFAGCLQVINLRFTPYHKRSPADQRRRRALYVLLVLAVVDMCHPAVPRRVVQCGVIVATVVLTAAYHYSPDAVRRWAAVLMFVGIAELGVHVWVLGWKKVRSTRRYAFDAALMFTTLGLWVGQLGVDGDTGFSRAWLITLSCRLLQLIPIVPWFRDTFLTVLHIHRFLFTAFTATFVLMYVFAMLGMEMFDGGFAAVTAVSATSQDEEYCRGFAAAIAALPPGTLALPTECTTPSPAFADNQTTFDTFARAMFTLFQIITGSNWHERMYQEMELTARAAAIFFVCFYFLSHFLVLNLVLSVFIDAFETKQWEMEKWRRARVRGHRARHLDSGSQTHTTTRFVVRGDRKLTTLSAYVVRIIRIAQEMYQNEGTGIRKLFAQNTPLIAVQRGMGASALTTRQRRRGKGNGRSPSPQPGNP